MLCILLFFAQRLGRRPTVGPIANCEGSKREFLANGVPFGSLGEEKIMLKDQNPQKRKFWVGTGIDVLSQICEIFE